MTTATNRPSLLVVVAGTGTEVGKTWVAARLTRDLQEAGVTVAARKPAQSYDPDDRRTDAHVLAEATGESASDVCPRHRWYEVPMAPPMAAEVLGRPGFTVADLAAEIVWPRPAPSVGLVESAGGVRSPLAADGDTVDLVDAVRADEVVVVADAGLGTISHVRLAVDALDRTARPTAVAVFLNRFDDADELHRRNREWLVTRDGLDVTTSIDALAERVRRRLLGTFSP
jgi:dethiobiotin synthetase